MKLTLQISYTSTLSISLYYKRQSLSICLSHRYLANGWPEPCISFGNFIFLFSLCLCFYVLANYISNSGRVLRPNVSERLSQVFCWNILREAEYQKKSVRLPLCPITRHPKMWEDFYFPYCAFRSDYVFHVSMNLCVYLSIRLCPSVFLSNIAMTCHSENLYVPYVKDWNVHMNSVETSSRLQTEGLSI